VTLLGHKVSKNPWIKLSLGVIAAPARLTLAALTLPWITGCASKKAGSGELVPVSVSAANYSQLSDEQLYSELNAPVAAPSEAPAARQPAVTHHYLLVPGEVYPNDVPADTVYREVEAVLEKRGYFNAEFEKRAGRVPGTIDYLLRIHYGRRLWLNPTVRPDRITWGNDGLVADRYKTGLISEWSRDSREGLSGDDVMGANRLAAALGGGFGMGSKGGRGANPPVSLAYEQANMGITGPLKEKMGAIASSDYFLVVVEAFRFDDVDAMDKKAPCVWAVFIAVPADGGQRFSDVLRAMLQAATPYFEETTHGLQIYEVPPGRVIIGNPKEVPQ
jgi:hypothetical protein